MYRYHRCAHEQGDLEIYAVRGYDALDSAMVFDALLLSRLSLKHVADGGTVAEEVISTIRTAQAFGTQKILSDMYDVHVGKANEVDNKAAVWHGVGLGVFFFVIYSAYGLGMCSVIFHNGVSLTSACSFPLRYHSYPQR